jgi:hypothetical protein
MLPGGGHEGKVYETTPDGREGWATYFVRRGFAVYNSDGVNRGASSWDMTNVALAAQNNAPVSDIPPMNRYTHELAWTQFRIGPALGVQNPGGQFPVEAFEQYTSQLVPAFRDPIEDDKNVAALVALLDRIGESIVLTWSQSGRFGVRAAVQRPHLVKAHFAGTGRGLGSRGHDRGFASGSSFDLSHTDSVAGRRLRSARLVRQRNFCDKVGGNCTLLNLTELGIFGNGHVVMVERNNEQVADLIIAFLRDSLRLKKNQP